MDNQQFLNVVKNSFDSFIASGTSRSTQKLKPLHGAIARDIYTKLRQDERYGRGFSIKSQGFGDDKEGSIQGRYIDKAVDITIYHNNRAVGGVAVKFVMQNYSQNSNNYFENMLGETANIRCNGIPYFQIFIILDTLPYYNKSKEITKWESFTEHNVSKYLALSNDDVNVFYHTPNKTLIFVVHVPSCDGVHDNAGYLQYFKNTTYNVTQSNNTYQQFGPSVIYNDYENFIEKVYHTILSQMP